MSEVVQGSASDDERIYGAQNPAEAAFCLRCGSRLSAKEESQETRRTVTVVFADVTGSTTLGEQQAAQSAIAPGDAWRASVDPPLA
jgi:class 3 adenylate cyclase